MSARAGPPAPGGSRAYVYACVFWSIVGVVQVLALHPALMLHPTSGALQLSALVLILYGLLRDRRGLAFLVMVTLVGAVTSRMFLSSLGGWFWLRLAISTLAAAAFTWLLLFIPRRRAGLAR